MENLLQKMALYAGWVVALIVLFVYIWKINRSPCTNHIQSFDRFHDRLDNLKKEHELKMLGMSNDQNNISTEIKLLKAQNENIIKTLNEIKSSIQDLYDIFYQRK